MLGGWALVGQDRAPLPVMMSQAVAGPGGNGDFRAGVERPQHDLSNPRVFTKVILYVKDHYVDPKRIKPKEMMISSLEYVEKTVPDVIVEGSADTGKVKITVGNKNQTFDISHVDSLWKMSFTLKDIFRFINENMKPMEDTRDVEYAAVNGMLSKLDPHSVLLRPDLYREMKLTTKGEFGGLGFVIQMKEGNLTVVKVLPKTPAHRAGIKKDDIIRKIGEESTVNMDLNEAVSKLRGQVDSRVTITVDRRGWEHPQVETLTRAMISIESVQAKLLDKGVGYVRLKNFQGNTTRDLQSALQTMQREAEATGGLKGLVLDLRGNPGGLLEQAIQVSDLFVSQGVIVATVGHSEQLREEKKAHPDEGDLAYPVAVLVNAGSASASEIVAGALKNLNRAVIIGRQTFGKGSVQVLYDFPDDSALKLTIAKYLTPGDVSIQEVGIVPDIQLTPTRVTKDQVTVFAPRKSMGEADLDSHFGNPNSEKVATKRDEVLGREKPSYELKYLKEDSKGKDASAKAQLQEEGKAPKVSKNDKADKSDKSKGPGKGKDPLLDVEDRGTDEDLDDQLDAESQDEIKEDFEVLFARDYVLKAPFVDRDKMITAGKSFVEDKRKEEAERINAAIGALGVDWSPGESPRNPALVAQLRPGPEKKIEAGDLLDLELTVENRGPEPVKRLRAWTESDNPFLDRREFVFGALRQGERRSWKVPVKLPKDLTSRRDAITVKLADDGGNLMEPVVSELSVTELPRPAFAFNWQVEDSCEGCNGDGVVQLGEDVDLVLDVTNTGTGKALDAFATIKNVGDPNVFIEKGRFKLGELAPGETKTARFVVDLKRAYHGDSFPLKLAIVDEPLEEFATEKIELPVQEQASAQVEPKRATVKLSDRAELRVAPAADAPLMARVSKAGVFTQTARVGDFVRVELDKDRFAFARAQDAREARGKATPTHELQYVARRVPPAIALNVDPAQGGTVADGERFSLSGSVTGAGNDVDLYVLVNDQKVYFKTVAGTDKEPVKFKFATDFPLKEGNNNVMVVARESQDFASRKTLVIRRRPAALAQKQDPGKTAVAP
ncbi:MAG TPA: MXAN_5808 family serine peptidase [Myxococcales bacterium]|nr:MXAN_5808 family serine peptidase [Myxococcales bacterium]